MDVRAAVEADADELAAVGDAPEDVMRNLVHDRAVRVAVGGPDAETTGERASERDGTGDRTDGGDAGGEDGADGHGAGGGPVLGFVSFDVRDGRVHVTQVAGTPDARERLLAEPVDYAASEGLPTEVIVPRSDETTRAAVEAAGFERIGEGPVFDGESTGRYRLPPDA